VCVCTYVPLVAEVATEVVGAVAEDLTSGSLATGAAQSAVDAVVDDSQPPSSLYHSLSVSV
jgi:hypothetical protein